MHVQLEPYNTAWHETFLRLRNIYATLLHLPLEKIQHVGSTAVPGLWAKPILDIDILIDNIQELPAIQAALENCGYVAQGDRGIPGRYAFKQPGPDVPDTEEGLMWMEHHLYVCLADALALKNHILFRDALVANPELTSTYSELKKQLAHARGLDRERYSKAKTEFILSVLEKAGMNETALEEIRALNT